MSYSSKLSARTERSRNLRRYSGSPGVRVRIRFGLQAIRTRETGPFLTVSVLRFFTRLNRQGCELKICQTHDRSLPSCRTGEWGMTVSFGFDPLRNRIGRRDTGDAFRLRVAPLISSRRPPHGSRASGPSPDDIPKRTTHRPSCDVHRYR